jgi:hypothetical protein
MAIMFLVTTAFLFFRLEVRYQFCLPDRKALKFQPDRHAKSIFFYASIVGFNPNYLNEALPGAVCQELRRCAPPSPVCLNCVKVDFEMDDKGVLLSHGDIVASATAATLIRDQYKESYASGNGYGLTISVPPDPDRTSWWAQKERGRAGMAPLVTGLASIPVGISTRRIQLLIGVSRMTVATQTCWDHPTISVLWGN